MEVFLSSFDRVQVGSCLAVTALESVKSIVGLQRVGRFRMLPGEVIYEPPARVDLAARRPPANMEAR